MNAGRLQARLANQENINEEGFFGAMIEYFGDEVQDQ